MRTMPDILKGIVAVVIIVFAGAGCMLRMWSQSDPAYDFSDVASFAWLRPGEVRTTDAPLANDALDALIREIIAEEMTASGYVESDRTRSQVLLDYRAALEKRKDVVPLGHNPDNNTARDIQDYDRGTEHGPRWGMRFASNEGWTWSEADPESYERHYEEGTLIVTMYDAHHNATLITRATRQRRFVHRAAANPMRRAVPRSKRVWNGNHSTSGSARPSLVVTFPNAIAIFLPTIAPGLPHAPWSWLPTSSIADGERSSSKFGLPSSQLILHSYRAPSRRRKSPHNRSGFMICRL